MPRKYDPETGARAVRLAIGHPEDYASEFETIRTVAGRLGMKPETLRKWIRQPRSITAAVRGGDLRGGPADPKTQAQERRAGEDRGHPEGGDGLLRGLLGFVWVRGTGLRGLLGLLLRVIWPSEGWRQDAHVLAPSSVLPLICWVCVVGCSG